MNVDTILADILQREGWPAYTDDSRDRGGPTKGGITMRTLEAWRGRRCTRKELRTLGEDEALRILKRRYVEANGINRLDRLPIQGQLVDNAVLSGPYIAIQDLQKALGTVTVDGICGPKTTRACVDADLNLPVRLAVIRALRLARHVTKNPDQLCYLNGCLSRALSFAHATETPLSGLSEH